MRYLLDTNICVYFLKQNAKIVDKVASFSADDNSRPAAAIPS